jgi:hypothetical protein
MHLVEMEIVVTAWQKPVRLALKPDTMRHLTKELVQWVESFTTYRNKIIHPGTDQIVQVKRESCTRGTA